MLKPFHLSFVVPDLQQARKFYLDSLGCDLGRDTAAWIDIIFFGHQLTLHQQNENMESKVIDHFGPVLDKEQWQALSQKLIASNTEFQLKPTIKNQGNKKESGKFIIKDPAGNIIEFKYYLSFAEIVAKSNNG